MPTSVDNWTRSSAVSAMVSALFAAVAAGAAFYDGEDLRQCGGVGALLQHPEGFAQDFGVRCPGQGRRARLEPGQMFLAWMSPIYHQRTMARRRSRGRTMEYRFCFGFAEETKSFAVFWTVPFA